MSPKRRSRKRSAASSPPEVTFFVDRALGAHVVPAALRAAGYRVERHTDHFAHDAPDTEWLAAVGARGWVVLTKDSRIQVNKVERFVLRDAGVAAFVLVAGNVTGAAMAEALVKAAPAMTGIVAVQERPLIGRITKGGEVRVWKDAEALRSDR